MTDPLDRLEKLVNTNLHSDAQEEAPAPQEPQARAVVVGSVWKQCMPPGMHVRVTIADADSIEFRWQAGPAVESNWFTWVSDPQEGEIES